MLTVRGSAKSGHDMSGRWSKVAMWGWNALPPPPMLMLSFCCPPSVAWAQATAAAPCATSSSAMQPSTQATRVRALLPLSLLPAGSGAAATTAAALFGAAANLPTCQPACLPLSHAFPLPLPQPVSCPAAAGAPCRWPAAGQPGPPHWHQYRYCRPHRQGVQLRHRLRHSGGLRCGAGMLLQHCNCTHQPLCSP